MWNVFPRSDVIVTGHNPEVADMSNPTGETFGEQFYLVAEDPRGYRRRSPPIGMNVDEDTALDTAGKAMAAIEKGELNIQDWTPTQPSYGSEAYEVLSFLGVIE